MRRIHNITLQLVRGEEGQDLIEYALLTALISIVAISGVQAVGSAVFNSFWSVIATGLSTQ
jgi:Flp pilus assembly pilin Flp